MTNLKNKTLGDIVDEIYNSNLSEDLKNVLADFVQSNSNNFTDLLMWYERKGI